MYCMMPVLDNENFLNSFSVLLKNINIQEEMEKLQKEKALGTAKHRKQVDNKLKNICRFKIRKFFF